MESIKGKFFFNVNLIPASRFGLSPAKVEALRVTAGIISQDLVTTNWEDIVGCAITDGFAGVLFWQLKENKPASMKSEIWKTLEKAVISQRAKYLYWEYKWRDVVLAFKNAGVKVVSLKGWVLDRTVYPKTGVRGMCDWDLLIDPKDIEKVITILGTIKYYAKKWNDPAARKYYFSECTEFGLDRDLSPHIDLHLALAHEIASQSTQKIISDAVVGPQLGEWIPSLPHQLYHIFYHGIASGSGYRLIWPLDAYFILKHQSNNENIMEQVVECAIDWGTPLYIYQAMCEFEAFLGFNTKKQQNALYIHLNPIEKLLAKLWRHFMSTRLSILFTICHRLSHRPITGRAGVLQSLFPSAGHTVITYNVNSFSSDFWKYRIKDILKRLLKRRW